MAEVIDIIQRLSFEVVNADALKQSAENISKQSANVERLQKQLEALNKQYATETNVKAQQNLSGAILKTTDSIELQTKAMQSQFASNRPLQQAITTELGLIQKLTDRLNDLRQARERQTTKSGISEINAEMAKLKTELASLQGLGGAEGGVFATLFGGGGAGGRQVLQGVLGGLGIGSALSIIPSVVNSLTQLAVTELDVIGKEEKLMSANKGLADSFNTLGDAILKFNEDQRLLDIGAGLLGQVDSIEERKRQLEDIKAIGTKNGEVFKAEKAQLEAAQELRKEELADLKNKKEALDQINRLLSESQKFEQDFTNRPNIKAFGDPSKNANVQYLLFNELNKRIADANLPKEITEKISLELKKTFDEGKRLGRSYNGASLTEVLTRELRKYSVDSAKLNQEIADKENEIKNEQVKFEEDRNRKIFEKNKALQVEISASNESFRQLKEREDIQSVDKITKDTQAKYKLLRDAILRDEEKTTKELGTLPASVKANFDKLLLNNKLAQNEENKQAIEAFLSQSSLITLQNASKEANTSASLARTAVAFGLPDYDALTELLDKEVTAKKAAINLDYVNTRNAYIKNGQDITNLQKQNSEQITNVDQQAYSDRLALATQYYQQLAKIIRDTSAVIATQTETAILNAGGSNRIIDRRRRRAQAGQRINDAERLLPDAQSALDQSNEAAVNANTPEATQAATNEALKQKAIVEGLNNEIAKSQKELRDVDREVTIERINLFQNFVNATVQGYEVISEARQKDLDREISARTQRVDMAYKLAERGNTQALALEQKALDAALQQRRKVALQEQAINAALAVSNAVLAVAKAAAEGGAFAPATIAAVVAALGVGFSQAYALNQAQKQQFYKGGYTGDGGKYDEAGTVHKGEFVIDKEKTARYRPLLEAIHKGGIPQLARADMMPQAESFASKRELSEIKTMLGSVVDAINGKEINVSQNVDKGGVFQMVREQQSVQNRLWMR